MRPLVAFTGQGIARADGFNLTRRLKAWSDLHELSSAVPWRDRQNLDELFAASGARGADTLDALVRTARAICLKERRSTERKVAHRALFQALAEVAQTRLVVHLTASIDGLTSTFAARDFGATWAPYAATASIDEVASSAAAVLRRGRGLLHFPVHGEAALVRDQDGRLRVFYGEPSALHDGGPWISTIADGVGRDVREITATLPVAAFGFGLLRALALGEDLDVGGHSVPAFRRADLIAIGYGAGSRPARALYPFERTIDEIGAAGAPAAGQRFSALLYDSRDCEPSVRWYGERGFAVSAYGDGDLGSEIRRALLQARTAARSGGPARDPVAIGDVTEPAAQALPALRSET